MNAVTLADRYTIDELADMAREIREREVVPVEERRRTGSIEMYPPAAKKKLTAISWAITYRLKAGRP